MCHLGCGSGVQAGAGAARVVFGEGEPGGQTTGGGAATPPAQPVPPPLKPVPPGSVYASEALVRMRGTTGGFKQASIWRKEFRDKPVVGQGTITKIEHKDFYGAIRVEIWLDVDDDDTVDIILNYMGSDLGQFMYAAEGGTIWFGGELKSFQDRLMIAGEFCEVIR